MYMTGLLSRSLGAGCAAALLMMPALADVRAKPAGTQNSPYVTVDLLSAERRDTREFIGAFDKFLKRADALDKQTTVTKSELDALIADAEAVKRAIPTFQRGASAMVSKLRTAGKWTPELDAFVERQLKAKGTSDARLQGLRTNGGARAVLESAATKIAELPAALDQDIRALRTKSGVVQRLVEELLGKPVYASLWSRAHACWMVYWLMPDCGMGDQDACFWVNYYCLQCVGGGCA